jgi:hypothetical protein
MNTDFTGKSLALTQAGLTLAAGDLAVNPPELWTVVAVETSGCGYLPDRRPQILFERHVFHRLTSGRFDAGDISSPVPGGYGAGGSHQYDRLNAAIALDRTAALQSASYGLGQIMGENFALAGFGGVEEMVAAMVDSEDAHMKAMSTFIGKGKLAASLQSHDWTGFASHYNGPSYATNHYDTKLAAAFQKYSAGAMPDLTLRAVQLYLTFCGYNPGPIDGVPGARTKAAVIEFQKKQNLPQTGTVDDALLAQLTGALDIS